MEEATSLFIVCEKSIGYHLIQSPSPAHNQSWGESKIGNLSGEKTKDKVILRTINPGEKVKSEICRGKRQGDGGQEKASRLVRGRRQDSRCVDHATKPPAPPGLG